MADNQQMIINLFGSIQNALFLGDPLASQQCASFLQPGQFLSTNIKENPGTKDMYNQAQIANLIYDTSFLTPYATTDFEQGAQLLGAVDQVYSDILNMEALPYQPLTQDQLNEIDSLNTWLSNHEQDYDLYSDLYNEAEEAYATEANSQNPDPTRLNILSQKVSEAQTNWETIGLKDLYENNQGQVVYLSQASPANLWQSFRTRMAQSKMNAPNVGSYYQTLLEPAISDWDNASWMTFEDTVTDSSSSSSSKQTSWSGGISAGWGLFSFGGGASGSTNFQHQESQISSIHLKFDYLRVKINRPWMVEDVLGYAFWTWKKEFGGKMISDGGNLGAPVPVRPIGRMPVLPEYLILVRNLSMSASFSQQEQSLYASQISTHASFGWGPFSLSGSYSEANSSQYVQANFDGVTFTVSQPQIIARTGILLAECPNPDHSLPWQGDQWFPGGASEDAQKIRQQDYQRLRKATQVLEARLEAQRMMGEWLSQKMQALKATV